jgi:hypothetical protein
MTPGPCFLEMGSKPDAGRSRLVSRLETLKRHQERDAVAQWNVNGFYDGGAPWSHRSVRLGRAVRKAVAANLRAWTISLAGWRCAVVFLHQRCGLFQELAGGAQMFDRGAGGVRR